MVAKIFLVYRGGNEAKRFFGFFFFFVEFNALPFVLVIKDFRMDKQTVSPRTDRQSGRALCPVLATTTVACFRAQVVLQNSTFFWWTYLGSPPFLAHMGEDN